MVFSSLEFLFLFVPLFLLVYYLLPLKAKNVFLFLGSLVFYGFGISWNAYYMGLIWDCATISAFCCSLNTRDFL